jgi:hypothetical protein
MEFSLERSERTTENGLVGKIEGTIGRIFTGFIKTVSRPRPTWF